MFLIWVFILWAYKLVFILNDSSNVCVPTQLIDFILLTNNLFNLWKNIFIKLNIISLS